MSPDIVNHRLGPKLSPSENHCALLIIKEGQIKILKCHLQPLHYFSKPQQPMLAMLLVNGAGIPDGSNKKILMKGLLMEM